MLGEKHSIYLVTNEEMISKEKKGRHIREDYFARLKKVTKSERILIRRKRETYQICFAGLPDLPDENAGEWKYSKNEKCYTPNLKTKDGKALNKAIMDEGNVTPIIPQYLKELGVGVAEIDFNDDGRIYYNNVEVMVNEAGDEFIVMIPKTKKEANKPYEDKSIDAIKSIGGVLITFGDYYDNHKETINQYVG